MVLNEICSILKNAKKIVILPHVSADGDAIGASLALALALNGKDREAKACFEEEIPGIYGFLGRSAVKEVYSGCEHEFDVAVALDAGDLDRLGNRERLFKAAKTTVNIDHHQTNSLFAQHNHVHTGSSAVGEIIYQLIRMMGISFDADMAECLYVAIATDTGGFRYSNTTSVTHQITADLLNNGVNVSKVSQKIFDSTSYEKVKLTGLAASSLELLYNGRIAFIGITNHDAVVTGAKDEDFDGIVNIGRNISGVEVSVLLREKEDGEIKVNLRSREYVDVSAVAGKFSGGGHKRAAGCTLKGTLEEAKRNILYEISLLI